MHTTFILTFTAVFICLFASLGQAREDDFLSHYYLSPSPDKVAAFFAEIDNPETPLKQSAIVPVAMFLHEVFKANPEVAEQLVQQNEKHSKEGRYTVAFAVYQAKLPQKAAYIDRLLYDEDMEETRQAMKDREATPLETLPVNSPAALDALWGAFSASGKAEYVRRIISALGQTIGADGKQKPDMVQGAARWSLGSQASQHKRVFEICKQEVDNKNLSPDKQEILENIVRSARDLQAAP